MLSFFIFAGQRSWKLCLQVYYRSQITASLDSQRKVINRGETHLDSLLNHVSEITVNHGCFFLNLFLMMLFCFWRVNNDEPLKWRESFENLLSSQSKANPPDYTWCKCFDHSSCFEMTTRCQPDVVLFPDGLCLFRAFLISEFSEENIAFYLACEEYKATKPSKRSAKAKKIYDEFIRPDAPREVNII